MCWKESYRPFFISYANISAMTAGSTAIAGIAGWQPASAGLSVNGAQPRRVDGQSVQSNFFSVLGVPMAAGRAFLEEEDASPGGVASVILGERLARELFASPHRALGQTVQLNSEPFVVVGVAAAAFRGIDVDRLEPMFWVTGMAYKRLTHWPPDRWAYALNRGPFYSYVVRAAPGVSVSAAFAELRARVSALAESNGEGSDLFKRVGPIMMSGLGAPRSLNRFGLAAVRLLAAVTGVLVLLGMANVASLLIVRGLKVGREVAIRKALGASAARLIQSALVESVVLALAGSAAGIAVALGIQEFLDGIKAWGIGTVAVPLDVRVLGTTVAMAMVIGIAFGAGPALLAARSSLLGNLGRGDRADTPRAVRLRHALAVVQLALSLTLLVGAMLFLQTLRNLRAVDLGIDPSGVTTMSVDLRSHGYNKDRTLDYQTRLLERLHGTAGLEHAAFTYNVPAIGGNYVDDLYVPGKDPKRDAIEVSINGATSKFFDVLGVKVIKGRRFLDAEELQTTAGPVLLSAAAAARLFGDADPIGRTVQQGKTLLTVVGVTNNLRWTSIDRAPDAVLFQPLRAFPLNSGGTLIVKSPRPSSEIVNMLRREAAAVDANVPLAADAAMTTLIDRRLAQQRLFARVLMMLGSVGIVLAAVGLHGLIAQIVKERAREFGIRVAVGASRREVIALVLRQAAIVAAAGLSLGLGTAWLSGRYIESYLFGVTSKDPLILTGAVTLLLCVVAIALIAPMRAALRVQPIDVLRAE